MKRLFVAFLLLCSAALCAYTSDYSVLDYGAKGDGETDCTEAFQQALDAAFYAGGGNVTVPAGAYAVKGNLVIKSGVFLAGTFQAGPTERYDFAPEGVIDQGSTLYAYAGKNKPKDKPFIELSGSNCGVKGLKIYYPEKGWDVPPVKYPPTIAGYRGDNQNIIDTELLNSYEGIRLAGVGRSYIRNVYGYPVWRGLYIDECYDISRVENCHFWPFGNTASKNPEYSNWINRYGTAFEFARTDWQYVSNCFCFGYGVGYKFSESKAGGCNGNFLGLGADSCAVGVRVEAAQSAGLLITNGEFVGRWKSPDSTGVYIDPGVKGKVSLMNCSFWGPLSTCITSNSDVCMSAIGCHFGSFGRQAVDIRKGTAIIENNTFVDGPLHINIGFGVQDAIVTGNSTEQRFLIKNAIGSNLHCALNNPEPKAEMTAAQKRNYYVLAGMPGSSPFVEGCHGMEDVKRWTSHCAVLNLPVNKNSRVTVTVELTDVTGHAIDGNSGIYLEGKKVAALTNKEQKTMSFTVNTGAREIIRPELRVKGWHHENGDHRELGVGLCRITVSSGKGKAVEANKLVK